jgi:hypothetical protein
VLTERCKLADRVVLQVGNALDLPYSDETFDVAWRVARGTTIFAKGDPGSGLMGVLAGTIKHDSSEWRVDRRSRHLPGLWLRYYFASR